MTTSTRKLNFQLNATKSNKFEILRKKYIFSIGATTRSSKICRQVDMKIEKGGNRGKKGTGAEWRFYRLSEQQCRSGETMEQPRERQIALQIGRRACATTCRKTRVIPWLADSCKRDFVARSNVPVCMFHVLTIRSRLRCYLTAPPLWLLPRPSGHESGFNAMISPGEWSFAGIDLKTAHGSAPNPDNRDVCSSVCHYTYNFVPVAHVRWWTCPSKAISPSSYASFHDQGYPLSSFIHRLWIFTRKHTLHKAIW